MRWFLWQSQLLPSYWRHLVSQQKWAEVAVKGAMLVELWPWLQPCNFFFLVGIGTVRVLTFPQSLPVPNQKQPGCLPHSIHKLPVCVVKSPSTPLSVGKELGVPKTHEKQKHWVKSFTMSLYTVERFDWNMHQLHGVAGEQPEHLESLWP